MIENKLSSVSRKKVESVLGITDFCPDFKKIDPRELLRYYRERSRDAVRRCETNMPGPKKTIEEHLLLFLIKKESPL